MSEHKLSARSVTLTVARAKRAKCELTKSVTVPLNLPYIEGDVAATAALYKLSGAAAVTTLLAAIAVGYAEPVRNHLAKKIAGGMTDPAKLAQSVGQQVGKWRAEGKTARLTADQKVAKLADQVGITPEQAMAALKLANIRL